MNALIACEESQRVCAALRALGVSAFSCDIQECSGGHPEWHIRADALPLLRPPCSFETMDGLSHFIDKWDLLIAHPPCTYLTNAGTRHYSLKCNPPEKVAARIAEREKEPPSFSWHLSMRTVNTSPSRIRLAG